MNKNLLDDAIKNERFDIAIDLLATLEASRDLHPSELVLRARCMQLHPIPDAKWLKLAEESLIKAIDLDTEYVPALIELGWLCLNVLLDVDRASALFENARKLSSGAIAEAVIGLARCAEEKISSAAALDVLRTGSTIDESNLTEEAARLKSSL